MPTVQGLELPIIPVADERHPSVIACRVIIERLRSDAAELAELRRLALDSRISNEILGMRIRNTVAAADQQTGKDT